MLFSKKILFGTLIGLSATAIVVGTAVGVSTSQNSVTSDASIDEMDESATQNTPTNTNQPDSSPSVEMTLLQQMVNKITKNDLVINELKESGEVDSNKSVAVSSLYAFNVLEKQLAIKPKTIKENNITTKLTFADKSNTAASLNAGKLNVTITLKTADETVSNNITLDGFKTANRNDFSNLLEQNNLSIKIDPEKDNSNNRFIDLVTLNTKVERIVSAPQEEVEEDELQPVTTQTETGLTSWLKFDATKKSEVSNISLEGIVKVSSISNESNKAIFHLVAKDQNNRIKLVKKDPSGNKEIVLDEIKTTNLLATDVTVIPTTLDEKRQGEYLKSLEEVGKDMPNMKYLTNDQNASLNRYLSVDLTAAMMGSDGMVNKPANKLFVKPYLVVNDEESNTSLPISVVVSFGKDSYLSTFNTSKESELAQLKTAGFSFGIYSMKLSNNEQKLPVSTFTDMKNNLEMYFTFTNYISNKNRLEKTPKEIPEMQKYPGGFDLLEAKEDMLKKDLTLTIEASGAERRSSNYLSFADYSYAGLSGNKVLFTPSISLIHLETNIPA